MPRNRDRDRAKCARKARKRRRKAERIVRLGKAPPKKGRRVKIALSPDAAEEYRLTRGRMERRAAVPLEPLDD